MYFDLTSVQLVGLCLLLLGLIVNNVGVICFYFRIKHILKQNGVKPNTFLPLAIFFQLRLLVRTALSKEKKNQAQGMLVFLNRLMLVTVVLIFFGGFLLLIG